MITLDHLGIAVKSLQQTKQFYQSLGLQIQSEETSVVEKVRLAMVSLGECRIELLEPTENDSAVGKFLAKRGEGLHHLALRVTNLQQMVERMKRSGTRFVTDEIKIGAGGHAYIFVHPASAGGVLLELCEDIPS